MAATYMLKLPHIGIYSYVLDVCSWSAHSRITGQGHRLVDGTLDVGTGHGPLSPPPTARIQC